MTLTDEQLRALPSREYAERGDRCIGASESTPHDRSPDAIGGAYGIAWYDVFENERGERYKVYCFDGERSGKGPYRNEDTN
jgi:hypothetical protein